VVFGDQDRPAPHGRGSHDRHVPAKADQHAIAAGEGDAFIAAGVESVSVKV